MRSGVRNLVRASVVAMILWPVHLPAAPAAANAGPTKSVPRQERKFVISRTEPEVPCAVSFEEMCQLWPVFPHVPYAESGFNHLTLPFHTVTNTPHALEEARAFAFLLSNALDWVPGNYCARHAYFVFKRARPEMLELEQKYDPAAIALQVREWRATHAIGGEINKGKDGYTGTLTIFNDKGEVAFEKGYDKPRSYFDLLGDMCDDCSQHVGHKPSSELSAHFRKPRCEKEASIWALGAAAFQEERTGEEFRYYRKILEQDPMFSEARYWIANQGYWQHGDRALYQQEKEKCLGYYLTEAVLSDFDVTAANAMAYKRFVDKAQTLVGADSPIVVNCRLRVASVQGNVTRELLEQGLSAARRYPNDNGMLAGVRNVVWDVPRGVADADLAIALSLTQLASLYMRGSSAQTRAVINEMAKAMAELGREDIAGGLVVGNIRSAVEDEDEDSQVYYMGQLGTISRLMRRFEEAIDVNRAAVEILNKRQQATADVLAVTTVCAAFLGDRTTFEDLKQQVIMTSGDQAMKVVLINYGQFLDGKPVDVNQLQNCCENELLSARRYAASQTERNPATTFPRPYPHKLAHREATVLLGEVDLANGTTNQRQRVTGYLELNPNDREFWILFDAYDRKNPCPESSLFYESLAWLHPECAWVMQAVKDHRERAKEVVTPDVADYLDILKTRIPDPWCGLTKQYDTTPLARPIPYGGIALAARKLVTEGKPDQARELINRYQTYAYVSEKPWIMDNAGHALRAYCNHLLHVLKIRDIKALSEEKPADSTSGVRS